jgi:beta-barrel assembly-enhancing protease
MLMMKYTKKAPLRFIFFSVFFIFFRLTATCHALSIPDEKELGKEFRDEIKKSPILMHDPIINHMVKDIGRHILSVLPPQPFDYSFYVVNSGVFNAFAAPGANIVIYRGLITSLDSIDELAGIIGHEIAHSVSRHISEAINRSRYINIGSLAGLLVGAVVAANTDNNEAASSLMTGSLAAGHTAMLAFTRENETEADQKAIMFLKKSCFAPDGLLSGLKKIRELDYIGVEKIPDYVKTHPGSGSRSAHVGNILSGYTPPENKAVCKENFSFDMVKHRLLGLYAPIEPTFTQLSRQLSKEPENAALHYGLSLLYDRKFRRKEELHHLRKALSIKIFDPMIILELGRLYQENGEAKKALEILEPIDSDPVLGIMARFYQAGAHLDLKNLGKAESLYYNVINKAPSAYPRAYYHLGNIMSLKKKRYLSHYYLGLFYNEVREIRNARLHLTKALERLDDPVKIENAKALLKELADQE